MSTPTLTRAEVRAAFRAIRSITPAWKPPRVGWQYAPTTDERMALHAASFRCSLGTPPKWLTRDARGYFWIW